MGSTRAGQLVGPGRMVFVEAPLEALRAGDVLVRSRYASICGSDLHVVHHGIDTEPSLWAPGYPGHEGVGEVVESRAPGFAPGDEVLVVPPVPQARCFSEWQRVRAGSVLRLEGPLPPLDQVLMAQQLGTVVFAARQQPWDVAGRTVVVIGQGSAGLFWAWWLKRAGAARVVVSDRSPSRLGVSPRFGADVVVDAGVDDLTDVVMDLTSGVGADAVVEAVGRRETLLQSVGLCREVTGYQEVLTDPSYAGQIVTMTAPQIGNYGVAAADHESAMPQVAGFVMRDQSPVASNWRAQGTLKDYLTAHGIVAIADIDTRALTRKLRSGGVMRGIIATGPVDPQVLVEKARSAPQMEGADLVKDVTCGAALRLQHVAGRQRHPGQLRRAAAKRRAATHAARGRLRLRHQDQHPAPAGRAQLRRAGVPGVDAGGRAAGLEARRHLPEQRPRRPGGGRLRDRERQGAGRRRGRRCSASASAISCWRWASAPRPTSSSSATAAPTTR